MLRCENHDPLGNQCEHAAVLTVTVVIGPEHDASAEATRVACTEHAWEATALAGREVIEQRHAGAIDPRVVVTLDPLGEELLELMRQPVHVRWPRAEPWTPA